MKKSVVLLLALSFVTLQSYKTSPVVLKNEIEVNASILADKFNIDNQAILLALTGYEKLKEQGLINNQRYLTIVDFSKPSNEERLYIIDMYNKELPVQTYVAHGRNSGTLFATKFSNKQRSNQSSLGFYITGMPYKGKHGRSLELFGMERGINDNVKQRAIVLHGANYVSNNFIQHTGYIGRSQGCPAVPNNQINDIIDIIQGQSCLFIYAEDQSYLNKSKIISNVPTTS